MTHYDINEFAKVQNIIKAFEGSDLVGCEFTKKEFDKVFKGISSLEWVREQGTTPSGRISWKSSWRKDDVVPFVKVARVEYFELPYKSTDYVYEEDVPYVNGEKCADIDTLKFARDEDYRKMCLKAYGNVEIRREKPTTFTACRNFYEVDMDVLKRATLDIEGAKEYFDDKIAECERKLARYKACREVFA